MVSKTTLICGSPWNGWTWNQKNPDFAYWCHRCHRCQAIDWINGINGINGIDSQKRTMVSPPKSTQDLQAQAPSVHGSIPWPRIRRTRREREENGGQRRMRRDRWPDVWNWHNEAIERMDRIWLWFGTWILYFHILGRIIPTDFHIFQRDWNQDRMVQVWMVNLNAFDLNKIIKKVWDECWEPHVQITTPALHRYRNHFKELKQK